VHIAIPRKAVLWLLCLIFFLSGLSNRVAAQSYSIASKLFEINLDTMGFGFSNGIEVQNTGTVNLNFTWELLLKDTLADSEFDLCNSGVCFNMLPAAGTMPTIPPGEKGWLKVHMFAGKVMGVNTIKYVLNGNGTKDTLVFRIIVGNYSPAALVEKTKVSNRLSIMPNPASDAATLLIPLNKTQEGTVKIYDGAGKMIQVNASHFNPGLNRVHLNTAQLPPGEYFLEVSTAEGNFKKQLLINR
jgi:hypothetical protein